MCSKSISKNVLIVFSLMIVLISVYALIFPDQMLANAYTAGTDETGRAYDTSAFLDGVQTVYNIARAICIPLAAISIAMAGYQYLMGDEDSQRKAKNQLFVTGFAIMALILLPTIVQLGVDAGRKYGWTPSYDENHAFTTEAFSGDDSDSGEGSEDGEKEESGTPPEAAEVDGEPAEKLDK